MRRTKGAVMRLVDGALVGPSVSSGRLHGDLGCAMETIMSRGGNRGCNISRGLSSSRSASTKNGAGLFMLSALPLARRLSSSSASSFPSPSPSSTFPSNVAEAGKEEKGKKGPLHFVFIEGEAATGKSTICQILKSRGYAVQFEGFVELCKEGSIVSIKWVVSQFNAFERFTQLHGGHELPHPKSDSTHLSQSGHEPQKNIPNSQFQGGVVFFDRSLLTPFVYARGGLRNEYVLDAMREIRQAFPCTTILCKADVPTIISRLRLRYAQGDEQSKGIRASLGELDEQWVNNIHDRYLQLEREGWFDGSLDTTVSEAQAVDNLLAMLRKRNVLAH